MLDQILSDVRSKAKNTKTEDTMISTSNPLTMQTEKHIPSLDILQPENAGAKFWSVAPKNVAELLDSDTVTQCKVDLNFRTNVKTGIMRCIDKCVEANLEGCCWIIRVSHNT